MFLGATEGDFIDICVVRGMFCLVDGRFYSLFTMAGDAKVSQNTWVPMARDAKVSQNKGLEGEVWVSKLKF